MRTLSFFLAAWLAVSAKAGPSLFDRAAIEDRSSLEVTVLQDWRPAPRNPGVKQKLIEITVCEWWEGQKVRLPVTLNAPGSGEPCTHLVIANQPLAKRAFAPKGEQLELLLDDGVGVILIGMGTIDAMEPAGKLHLGMRRQLLETKNPRFTPAWIWGMSQMRALTAALTEPEVFAPEKVLATGGSKRGVASAIAGIHDARFTAILPVVAPPLGNPGTPSYVIGTEPAHLLEVDRHFYDEIEDRAIAATLRERAGRRNANRVTLEDARKAGWTDRDIAEMTDRVWDACRVSDFLPALEERGLDVFYCVGTNDSVTPSLLELGKRFPEFPACLIPGGQHGGPATAGFTRRTPLLPEVRANFLSFARHHFFGEREMIATPRITARFARETRTLHIVTTFPEGMEPEKNELWWSVNRSEPYTLPYEYDRWESLEMTNSGAGRFSASVTLEEEPRRIDFLSLHTHTEKGLPLTISSPVRRIDLERVTVALIGDSTVTDKAGWGRAFAGRFGNGVTVHNFAAGGRSAKSWLAEGRLPAVRMAMPDYLLIQFGHNGQPGKGPQRETDPDSTYRDYLRVYLEEASRIGAIPILLSSVTRRDFTPEGKIRVETPEVFGKGMTRPLRSWARAARAVAEEEGVAFIDLYELSVELHNRLGPEASAAFSPTEGDITHFNEAGAEAIADLIVGELERVEPGFAAFLR